jgi:hypothetical protein
MDDLLIKEIAMCSRRRLARNGALLLAGAAALSLLTSAAGRAGEKPCAVPAAPAPSCPSPTVPSPLPTEPSVPPTPSESLTTAPNVQLGAEGMGARGETTAAFAAPNVIGDLLFTSRSVSFGFIRVNGNTDFIGLASTSIVNSSVAENNSPVPADRLYFRYNFFSDSQAVTGLSPNSITVPGATGVFIQLPETKKYDSNIYTFGAEKTFLDGCVSVELRAPVVTSLASHNTLSVADVTGSVPGTDSNGNPLFSTVTTPQNTLGHEDTEFGDLTVILKGLIYRNRSCGWYVSGGLGVLIPTGEDTHVTVIDVASTASSAVISGQREKDITIANDTWSLSPFLAALYTPNDRLFTQGFASVEVPVGSSRITYSDRQLLGHFGPAVDALAEGSLVPPFSVASSIREQYLVHLDWNVGYWVYQNPGERWLSGVAPCFEVHYTGTLNNADRVQLPGDATAREVNPANPIGSILTGNFPPETGPVVGGPAGHVHIVDLTAGTTFTFGDRTMLAVAATVPVTSGDNKTFNWEFQLQLNYYFGHRGGPAAPPIQ